MFGLRAVARHTLRQCLRMKVAALFIVLLAAALTAMPFLDMMKGDGTLAGKTRTFLVYSTSLTMALLSLVTIFLGTGIVSSDVRDKQIFSVATKPISRWQYILGRWVGVVMFDALLLCVSACAIYGLARYLRAGEAINDSDRRAVETEVFTARRKVSPEPLEIGRAVEARIQELQDAGEYEDALEAFVADAGGDVELGEQTLRSKVYNDIAAAMQSVAPGRSMTWKFSGVRIGGSETRDSGRIMWIAREDKHVGITAAPRLLGKLAYKGPVRINGVDGRVEKIAPDNFVVRFPQEEMLQGRVALLTVGKTVEIVADPTIQVTYKASPSSEPPGPDRTLSSIWEIQNPTDGFFYLGARNDPPEIPATLTVSARVVDAEGQTVVRYVNTPKRSGFGTSVTILHEDVAVLYREGSFEGNFVRAIALIFVRLAFLAGLAVLAGSFVSFPVACLICFVLGMFIAGRNYLIDAVMSRAAVIEFGMFARFSRLVVKTMNLLLPDFTRTSPADALVDGMKIPWWGTGSVGETALLALCLQTTVLLIIACLIFRKRELGRVQV